MASPLISIIIPTFNRAHLLGKTLDSILAQTYQNWECIIVDDGSTDDTRELLLKYIAKDNRFQYHHRPKDRLPGGNAARNYGLEICCGEYVNWFDSGDLMLPNKLELQLGLLHQTSYDYNICQTIVYDIDKNKDLGLRAKNVFSERIFEDYVEFRIFWLTGAPLWKCSFLQKYHLSFDEKLKQSQDYDFHIRVLAVSENYSFTEESLVKFCYHSKNMSNSLVENNDKLKSNLFVKNEIFKKYRNRISLKTKRIVYNHLLVLYRQVVFTRSFKNVAIVFPALFNNISEIKIPIYKRIGIIVKIVFGSLLYITLRKGYSFLEIKV